MQCHNLERTWELPQLIDTTSKRFYHRHWHPALFAPTASLPSVTLLCECLPLNRIGLLVSFTAVRRVFDKHHGAESCKIAIQIALTLIRFRLSSCSQA